MELLKKFVEESLRNSVPFSIESPRGKCRKAVHHFVQDTVGKARYVYSISDAWDNNYYASLSARPKLVAILDREKVYVVDGLFFGLCSVGNSGEDLPKNVKLLSEHTKAINDFVRDNIFPAFYDELKVDENPSTRSEWSLLREARLCLLSKDDTKTIVSMDPIFSEQDVAYALCGFVSIQEEACARLNEKRDLWVEKKSIIAKIKKLMETPGTIFDWEAELAEVLRSTQAKMVTVEFVFGGKTSSIKMKPDVIMRRMINNDYFSIIDFESMKKGEELLTELGAKDCWPGKDGLRCRNISKVMYKGKVLYSRRAMLTPSLANSDSV